MGRFGLIGDPIGHSKSPALFEAAYRNRQPEDGGPFTYDLIEGSDFDASWAAFIEGYDAINVTAPYKERAYSKVIEYASAGQGGVFGPAAKIGATNLVIKTPKGLQAHNSDFTGIITALAEAYYPGIVEEFLKDYSERFFIKVHQFFRLNLGKRFRRVPQAVVVGCGGAGRAAAVAAAELGFETALMNRTVGKAQKLADELPEYSFLPVPISSFTEAVRECELVIYTLPVALPQTAGLTADDFAGEEPGCGKVVLEANYLDPAFDSALASKIAYAGGTYIPGRTWLLHQALTGYSLMSGVLPDLKAMEEVF